MIIGGSQASLALDTAGAVAASQLLHLIDADHVVVAFDGVLQAGGRHGELKSRLAVLAGEEAVDQARAEAVAAADPVDDADAVLLGEVVFVSVLEHGGPVVVIGGVGGATFSKPKVSFSCFATLL